MMLSALSWIPRGVAKEKLPKGANDDDEMDVAPGSDAESDVKEIPEKPDSNQEDGDEDPEIDIDQVLSNDLDNLSFYKRNEDDPYLASDPQAKELFDDEELEDLVIRPTDALIVTAKSGEDVSSLEVYLFDDDPDASDDEDGPYTPHCYVHHDLVLPVLPLCTAYTRIPINDEHLNLVAVGMFTPGIDIWDIDRVNNLEPVVSLGGFDKNDNVSRTMPAAASAKSRSKKKKKKPKLRLRDGSHKDAVMCLSWNNVQKEYLASGSADATVKIWDIESVHCAQTLTHHSDKVQSVAFHPSSAELLLTGSFDKTVQLLDVRDPSKNISWAVDADVESCQWGVGPTAEQVIVATEDGFLTVFDRRMAKHGGASSPLAKWRAHKGATSAFCISQDVPGLMVSGGVDKMVKVWDISSVTSGDVGKLVYERASKAGALFALSLCPLSTNDGNASPFVAAYGGSQGALRVVDLAVESEAVRNFFLRFCPSAVSAAIKKRAARGKQGSSSTGMHQHMRSESEDDDADDDDDDDGDGSGWESA